MYREPQIPDSQKLGLVGEKAIESRLSTFSSVMRPGYDVGIDYFCELIEKGSPSGRYFCVQAKSTRRFKNYWKGNIKKETLAFWLNQRYPVFLVVYEQSSGNCYWASIQDLRQILNSRLEGASKTICVKVDRSNTLEENGDNPRFIKKIRKDGLLVNALHGIPEFVSLDGYVGFIPALSLTDTMRGMIRERVRYGIDYLIYDCLLRNDPKNAYPLSQILTQFDHGHYDHFLIHARICRRLKEYEEAEKNYNTAINICKDDPNWNKRKGPQDPSIEDIIAMIEDEKAKFRLNPEI